jgi:Tfp pilus assembly protein PilO
VSRRWWIGLVGGGGLAAAGIGALIYLEHGSIAQAREAVADLRSRIEAARKQIAGTNDLEREVIVLRETEEAIKEILPDEGDINNFVRDMRRFEDDAGVRITALKKKPQEAASKKKNKEDFDKVAYQLTFDADAFQLLSFLDRLESHSRFMLVPSFKLSAASRRSVEEAGQAAHKVQMDVETYVYEPHAGAPPVKIDGYARKRELLLGEITRRRQALSVETYSYAGSRGRRDPWVDPRVPMQSEESGLSVQEQQEVVDGLVALTRELLATRDRWLGAANVVDEMVARADLEALLARLEEELRRVEGEGLIRYKVAQSRLQQEVVAPVAELRRKVAEKESGNGPSVEALRELHDTMVRHLAAGEHELALSACATFESRLDYVRGDPAREAWVTKIRRRRDEAQLLSDFSRIKIDIRGFAIMEGRAPVILINGRALGEGDLVDNELMIRGIRAGEIEFVFRGVVLVRRF